MIEIDKVTLRKIQLIQLEMLEEVDRIVKNVIYITTLLQERCLGLFDTVDIFRGMMMQMSQCFEKNMKNSEKHVKRNWIIPVSIFRIIETRKVIVGDMEN